MNKQWILVANSAIARFFGRNGLNDPLVVLETLHHPAGRLQRSELARDRPGHAHSDTRAAATRFEPNTDPKRKSLHPFAQAIADRLDEGRSTGQFDTLWLFASSPLLGELKPALGRATDRRVEVAQDVDLTALDVAEIETRLRRISQPVP